MQLLSLMVIAVAGILISLTIEQKRSARVRKLIEVSKVLTRRAQLLASGLGQELGDAIGTVEACLRVPEADKPSAIEIRERVVYTKRTMKAPRHPVSTFTYRFSGPKKTIAVGTSLDPSGFHALGKPNDRNRALAESRGALGSLRPAYRGGARRYGHRVGRLSHG
jgi:hypothetical protein